MCYKGKCFFCIPVENGCLVLAILSAIATGLVLLASIILGFLTAAGIIFASSVRHSSMGQQIPEGAVAVAGIAVGGVIALVGLADLIAFIFSVLLCNGICNRRPGQVKSYFIYGVVITVLAVLASILQIVLSSDPTPGIMGLVGCGIYSLFLVLVHQTYSKLCAGVVFKDHIRLVEDHVY